MRNETAPSTRSVPTRGGAHAAPREPGQATRPSAHRRDVQGLRALAVLVVVADHLWKWPAGGFIGVDVFFVVSGFVITGLLLRELGRTGRISFRTFYVRRAKRLLPAGLTVLVTTLIAAHEVFSPTRFRETISDVVAAALFSGNWHIAAGQTDYFAADGPVSPVQHYWSLSVEEQFYVAWPLLLIAAFALCHRRIALVLGVVVLASLAWAFSESAGNPTLAYFSTFSRGWELGAGALVATWTARSGPLPLRLGQLLRWLGLVAIVASLFLITSTSRFPAPWALLPVLGTTALLVGGHGVDLGRRGLLTHPVSVRIGDLSYSIYLWHFPVIILAGELVDIDRVLTSVLLLALIAVLSLVSYHLVEDPLRHATWGGPRAVRPGVAGILVVPVCLLLLIAAVTPGSGAPVVSALAPGVAAPVPGASAAATWGPKTSALQAKVTKALGASSWPEGLDGQLRVPLFPKDVERCSRIGQVPDGCSWGPPSATRTAVIVGDSLAVVYIAPLRKVLAAHGYRLETFATAGCTFTARRLRSSDPDITKACPEKKEEAVAGINRLRPDLLIVTNTYGGRVDAETGKVLTPQEWKASQERILDRVLSSVGRLVFLSPPAFSVNLKKCYGPISHPVDCVSRVGEPWYETARVEAEIAADAKGLFVDTRPLYCDPRGLCPSIVDGMAVKQDQVHTSLAYTSAYVPALGELLTEAHVFG